MPRGRALLIVALVAACVLRLPALWHDLLSDDEAIYAAMGEVIASGGVMYRDTVDHKPPGLAYTYAAVRTVVGGDATVGPGLSWMTGVHLLGILWVLATCLVLDALGARLLGERLRAVPALLYGVVSAAKVPYDGLAVNGELLMNLPIALAAFAAIEAGRRRGAMSVLLDIGAGVGVAAAMLYKYQAGVLLAALPLLFLDGDRPPAVRVIARLAAWIAGVGLVIGLTAAYFHSRGALGDAVFWGLSFNQRYLGDGPGIGGALTRLAMQSIAVVLPGIALYAGGAVGIVGRMRVRWGFGAPDSHREPGSRGDGEGDEKGSEQEIGLAPRLPGSLLIHDVDPRRGPDSTSVFLLGWAIASIAAVALGGRFFGHYFLQPELPLSLIAAAPFTAFLEHRPRLAVSSLAVPAAAFFVLAALPAGRTDPLLHADDPDWRSMARAIAERTDPSHSIWVWGNVPQLYSASGRRQGARFSFCNYITGLSPASPSELEPGRMPPPGSTVEGALAMVLDDLARNQPALVIDTAFAGMKSYEKFPIDGYPPLAGYLALHYVRDGSVLGAVVYRRAD